MIGALWLACADPDPEPRGRPDPDPEPTAGEGPFAEGCPAAGRALARRMGPVGPLPGAVAVGGAGDWLLANDRAAFVITDPFDGPQVQEGQTYAYYGGIVADAAPVAGCVAGEDGLDEVHLVLGTLELTAFEQSVLRSFRGERASVLADGSDGGPAVVRVEGTDATHWLVEGELLNDALGSGKTKSQPWGLELVVDYVLEPDSPVLRTEWTLRNPGDADLSLLTASLLSFDPRYDVAAAGGTALSFGGFSLDADVAALTATSGDGAFAFGVEDGRLAYTGIAGIDVSLDLDQVLTRPVRLPPGGEDRRVTLLAVAAGSGAAATGPLLEGLGQAPDPLGGAVVDPDGAPVAGAWVDVFRDAGAGAQVFDRARTDAEGRWSAALPPGEAAWSVAVRAEGRDGEGPLPVDPGDDVVLGVGPAGTLWMELDADGGPVPARVSLERDDGLRATVFTPGRSEAPLPPGSWRYVATHGFAHAPKEGSVEVPAGGVGLLGGTLEREVPRGDWRAIDTHVHSAESPDSRMDPAGQVLHAAAHGVDVVVHTEHEHVVDVTGYAPAAQVQAFVQSLGGQEVTATIPEHLTMIGVVPDGSPRGGFVDWYGKDLDQIFAAMRERTGPGGLNLLNHPNYLDRIGWDVVTAEPTLADPTGLGLARDAALWSWDFDGIEVQNGTGSPFADGNHRFELWQSLLNAGHRIAPIGCSDDHGGDEVGFARTLFPGGDPTAAIRAGEVVVSLGAWLDVDVDGVGPGGTATAVGGVAPVRVVVRALRAIDVSHAVVFAGCDQVATLPATDRGGVDKLDVTVDVPVAADTQVTVAVFGEGPLPEGFPALAAHTPRALSGAIWIDADGDGALAPPGGRVCAYDLAAP